MAHFAKLDLNNIVEKVLVVHNNELLDENGNEVEQKGIDFLKGLFGVYTNWKQCSYNTSAGVHKFGGTPFRKNYAGKGMTYDESRDAFIPIKPYVSFVFNETSCCWDPPVAYPSDGNTYEWNEDTVSWDQRIFNPPASEEEES